jgi:hypothetical protein
MYMAAIFMASTQPTMPLEGRTALTDKEIHALVYLGLTLLTYRAAIMLPLWRALDPVILAAVISALHGIIDELHQWFVAGRHCEICDWLADMAGTLAAVLAIVLIRFLTGKGGTRSVRRRER